jgi:hypothetical protein
MSISRDKLLEKIEKFYHRLEGELEGVPLDAVFEKVAGEIVIPVETAAVYVSKDEMAEQNSSEIKIYNLLIKFLYHDKPLISNETNDPFAKTALQQALLATKKMIEKRPETEPAFITPEEIEDVMSSIISQLQAHEEHEFVKVELNEQEDGLLKIFTKEFRDLIQPYHARLIQEQEHRPTVKNELEDEKTPTSHNPAESFLSDLQSVVSASTVSPENKIATLSSIAEIIKERDIALKNLQNAEKNTPSDADDVMISDQDRTNLHQSSADRLVDYIEQTQEADISKFIIRLIDFVSRYDFNPEAQEAVDSDEKLIDDVHNSLANLRADHHDEEEADKEAHYKSIEDRINKAKMNKAFHTWKEVYAQKIRNKSSHQAATDDENDTVEEDKDAHYKSIVDNINKARLQREDAATMNKAFQAWKELYAQRIRNKSSHQAAPIDTKKTKLAAPETTRDYETLGNIFGDKTPVASSSSSSSSVMPPQIAPKPAASLNHILSAPDEKEADIRIQQERAIMIYNRMVAYLSEKYITVKDPLITKAEDLTSLISNITQRGNKTIQANDVKKIKEHLNFIFNHSNHSNEKTEAKRAIIGFETITAKYFAQVLDDVRILARNVMINHPISKGRLFNSKDSFHEAGEKIISILSKQKITTTELKEIEKALTLIKKSSTPKEANAAIEALPVIKNISHDRTLLNMLSDVTQLAGMVITQHEPATQGMTKSFCARASLLLDKSDAEDKLKNDFIYFKDKIDTLVTKKTGQPPTEKTQDILNNILEHLPSSYVRTAQYAAVKLAEQLAGIHIQIRSFNDDAMTAIKQFKEVVSKIDSSARNEKEAAKVLHHALQELGKKCGFTFNTIKFSDRGHLVTVPLVSDLRKQMLEPTESEDKQVTRRFK